MGIDVNEKADVVRRDVGVLDWQKGVPFGKVVFSSGEMWMFPG